MKKAAFLLLLFISSISIAQVKGKIINKERATSISQILTER